MIGKLKGLLDSLGDGHALIDVGGVGYEVTCSARTLAALPGLGGLVTLYIDTVLRQDFIRLYGFSHPMEKQWFAHLQTVQGVGAKAALAILDILSPSELHKALVLQEKTAFSRAAGVGPKLAGRIISELKDKPLPGSVMIGGAFTPPSSDNVPGMVRNEGLSDMLLRNDAISALVNLGYNEVRAGQAVMTVYTRYDEDPPLDVLIKQSLQEIAS